MPQHGWRTIHAYHTTLGVGTRKTQSDVRCTTAQIQNTLAGDLFTRTKGSGAEVIKRKGGAGFAVGIAIRDVIESIALDRRCLLPVSTVQNGCYGIRDVALSVPTKVGRSGVLEQLQIDLWPKEIQGLRASGVALQKTLETVLARIG